jgi:flagellar motor switch/type III secretory pathway protein FliN
MAVISQPPPSGTASLADGAADAPVQANGPSRSMEDHPAWPMISRLPAMLAVNVPLSGFKVRDLLSLEHGQTVGSDWAITEDVPLKVGELQICWGEFEVVEQQMALRLTRLA